MSSMRKEKTGIMLIAALAAVVSLTACQKPKDGGSGNGTEGAGQFTESSDGSDNSSDIASASGDDTSGEDARPEGGYIGENVSQTDGQSVSVDEGAGNDLDHIEPDPADDDWYKKGSIYKDSDGNSLEVFFNDEGMLEFAVDGLSLYFTSVDSVQFENNWRIYSCDDGTMIVYYPGAPAHIEILDDAQVLYEENVAQK